jgi:hypothetical protein
VSHHGSSYVHLGLAESADQLVDRAEQAKLGYRELLDLVLESEIGVLDGRRYASRLKLSGLPHHKTSMSSTQPFSPSSTPSDWPSPDRCVSSSDTSAR